MNIFAIFLQMLPIVVFIIVDSIVKNTLFSIISAIVFSIIQVIITYIIMKKFDYFIFLDAGLMVLLGVISIVFNNEIFFKMKPALIEGIFVIFIFVMLILPDSVLINYFSRSIGGMKIDSVLSLKMKRMLLIFNIYILFHIGAIIYTAFYTSRRTWALVSGPGFYFIFIPLMLFIFIKKIINLNKRKKIRTEIEDVINDESDSNDVYTV